ncbi:hypothetical protein Trydic_g15517 [Trypoxylus dichotomus]
MHKFEGTGSVRNKKQSEVSAALVPQEIDNIRRNSACVVSSANKVSKRLEVNYLTVWILSYTARYANYALQMLAEVPNGTMRLVKVFSADDAHLELK